MDNREEEFYQRLPPSWVIPGIATRDGELKINPVSEYLVPHNRYDSIFDYPDEDAPNGDQELLDCLDDQEQSFILAWAELGSAEAAAERLGLEFAGDDNLEAFSRRIADKMEVILKERRLNL